MLRRLLDFCRDERGAVAPTIALILFALIAAGGIAFDYARMAALDTELQNAADQAALAAAGQLDGRDGARARATSAAQGLVANATLFANDGDGPAVTVPIVIFYRDYNSATGAKGPVATTDGEANYVLVTVGTRVANYALTPVVAALNSGPMTASAFAGLSSAICNTPPVMMCNPSEPVGNTDVEFPFDGNAFRGVGLRLITGNANAPGNFGFLETGFGSGASNLARALGHNTPPGECSPINGVSTKPGLSASVIDALNTRFDLDANGNQSCPSGGTCSPSRNVRKDLVTNQTGSGGYQCGTSGNNAWREAGNPYRPADATPLPADASLDPEIMGHPRDICHALSESGSCAGGRIGDGVWDRDAYFRVNYGWSNPTWRSQTGLPANATRYEVYMWEMANPAISDSRQPSTGNPAGYSYPICLGAGIIPGAAMPDRRRIAAAVINCRALGLNGNENNVPVLRWIDLFLVEPSYNRGQGTNVRTREHDVYVEVIGETTAGSAGATAGQVVRRDVPRLIE